MPGVGADSFFGGAIECVVVTVQKSERRTVRAFEIFAFHPRGKVIFAVRLHNNILKDAGVAACPTVHQP